jgi:hypothetical protein
MACLPKYRQNQCGGSAVGSSWFWCEHSNFAALRSSLPPTLGFAKGWGTPSCDSCSRLRREARATRPVPWSEEWTSSLVDDDAPNDNWSLWGRPTETGDTGTILVDYITGPGVNNNPVPNPLPVCTGTPVKIQHWGQQFRVGSSVSGLGRPVQTEIITLTQGNHSAILFSCSYGPSI